MEATGAEFVFNGCQLLDRDTGTLLEELSPPAGAMENYPEAFHSGAIVIQPSTVVLKTEVIRAIGGFDPKFPICDDFPKYRRKCDQPRNILELRLRSGSSLLR
jgi:hypothetical protein